MSFFTRTVVRVKGTTYRGIRDLFRNPIRMTIILVLLGVSLTFVATMVALNGSIQQRLNTVQEQIGNEITITPIGNGSPGSTMLTKKQIQTIESIAGINAFSQRIIQSYTGHELQGTMNFTVIGPDGKRDTKSAPVNLIGVTPGANDYQLMLGKTTLADGRTFSSKESNADVLLVSTAVAQKNNLKIGSSVTLNGITLTVIGTYTTSGDLDDNTIVVPISIAQKILNIDGVTTMNVYAANVNVVNSVEKTLRQKLGTSVQVTATRDNYLDELNALASTGNNAQITLKLSLATVSIIIIFTVISIVRERKQEIGLFKAIGAPSWQVVGQFGIELAVLNGIAACVAALFFLIGGNSLAHIFNINAPRSTGTGITTVAGGVATANGATLTGTSGGLPGIQNGVSSIDNAIRASFSAGLTPQTFLLLVALCLFLTLLASTIPVWYVARTRPVQVLHAE
jgi:putative ABC transport system permease protein